MESGIFVYDETLEDPVRKSDKTLSRR